MTGPHNPLGNKPFVNLPPISCCSINCRALLRGRQQAAAGFPFRPSKSHRRLTASTSMPLWKAPFRGTWPKDHFQFWLLYFRQSTYTHPGLDAPLQACFFTFLRFYSGKFSLTSILCYVFLREQFTDALGCAEAEEPALCSVADNLQGSLSPRCSHTLPPAPSAMGSQWEAPSRGTPQKKLQPLFLPSCPCAGGEEEQGWAPSCSQERFFPAQTW